MRNMDAFGVFDWVQWVRLVLVGSSDRMTCCRFESNSVKPNPKDNLPKNPHAAIAALTSEAQ